MSDSGLHKLGRGTACQEQASGELTDVNSLTDFLPSESLMMNSASVFSEMPMLFSSSAAAGGVS